MRLVAGSPPRRARLGDSLHTGASKLERLFGADVWSEIRGRVVLDFGCGEGAEAVEMAARGARRVVGLDIRESVLARARARATTAGVADRCVFTTRVDAPADLIVSLDAFEHFPDPAGALGAMRRIAAPGGRVLIAFGPPWLHPYGGHLFSVFPWAHLVFSEAALLRWRSEFKTDGATRFGDVEGGLNGMTVRRFAALVRESGWRIEHLEAVPIRRLRAVSRLPLLREFTTSIVRCRLRA